MTRPIVIHIHAAPPGWQTNPDYVYIGRAVPRRGIKAGKLYNPFSVKKFGRERAISEFEMFLRDFFNGDSQCCESTHEERVEYRAYIKGLAGKTLICWCAPLDCHGRVLADLCEELNGGSA